MSSNFALTRSTQGCLTCKQRRKKCDETKPRCQRCVKGEFECLGYAPRTVVLKQRQNNPAKQEENAVVLKRSDHAPVAFLKTPDAEPMSNEDVTSFIKSQFVRLSHRIFRPFPFPIERGVTWRVNNSDIMRWTMFIGARILQAVLDGTSKEQYAGWISRFHAYVLASVGLDSEFSRLRAQLSSLQD
ncbi:Maltose acetyltransferase, partial [Ceratobasidium sp. 394]